MKLQRWEKLSAEIQERDLAGIVLVPGPNFYYMTGLRMGLSERPTVCAVSNDGRASFVMPKLEASKGLKVSDYLSRIGVKAEFSVTSFSDEEGPAEAFRKVFASMPRGVWAVEYRAMRLLEYSLISQVMSDGRWVDAGEIMKKLRMIKDDEEIATMEKACLLADLGADIAKKMLAPGVRPVDVVLEIEMQLKSKGAMAVSMSLAVGEDTAIPHSHTSERPVTSGQLAWLDLVVCVDGYWGDITRTYVIGDLDEELQNVYRIVVEAQEYARTHVRLGMTGAQVDALARDYIASRGYGQYFIHRTGHGLGLEVHEDPYIVASNNAPLPQGSVFTIEPGIYIPGKGGVRIEDDVVLTPDGARSLTAYPRNLMDNSTRLVV